MKTSMILYQTIADTIIDSASRDPGFLPGVADALAARGYALRADTGRIEIIRLWEPTLVTVGLPTTPS